MVVGIFKIIPVPSTVNIDTVTMLAVVARGGIVAMATHTVSVKSFSLTAVVVGTENTAAINNFG